MAGSTRAARKDGIHAARAAVTASTMTAVKIEMGSVGEISNNSPRIPRARAKDPASPVTKPIPIQIATCYCTCKAISRGRAPKAMRTPISRVCCATRKDSTP